MIFEIYVLVIAGTNLGAIVSQLFNSLAEFKVFEDPFSCGELEPLHRVEFRAKMVVGTKGYKLRGEGFWLSRTQRFWDIVDAYWVVTQIVKVKLSEHFVNLDDPVVFIYN